MFLGIIKRFGGLLNAFRNVTFWSGFSKEKKKKGEFLTYFSQKIQDMVRIEDACDLL